MVIAIAQTPNAPGYYNVVHVTGLTAGTRYDVMRRLFRYTGDDDTGTPRYTMPLPDRRTNWSSVAHRVGWPAPAGGALHFRDYDAPLRPFEYFVVPTTSVGPTDWDFHDGDYPLGRGTLGPISHLNRLLDDRKGGIVVRSTARQGQFAEACVFDIVDLRYTARGTEFPVMGNQYPVFVSDTREARRGTLVLMTDTLSDYDEVREIVFPANGRVRPVLFDTFGGGALLLDDMTAIPLDVQVEPATKADPDTRFITIDFVESDPTRPRDQRSGDNDDLTTAPTAAFTFSKTNPHRDEWITVTDTSTGGIVHWRWSWYRGTDNQYAVDYGPGPHRRRWHRRGDTYVKLRVESASGEVDVLKKKLHVG